jgi:phosphonate transport system substrate-binding protein
MPQKSFLLICLFFLLFLLPGCDNQPDPVKVDLEKRSEVTVNTGPTNGQGQTIRLGIGSMITPKEGYVYYRRLASYLEKKLERPVTIVDRGTYREFNALLASNSLDLAFVCGGPYVEGHRDFELELLVAPETPAGETVYYSYLIVPKESTAKTLEDLRGKKFAFTDPQSNTGCLVPTYMLSLMDETPEHFFDEVIFTYAHDKSIQAVASGHVAGASVDSLIYDYLLETDPEQVSKTRILTVSDPYGIPPVVVRPNLSPDLREKLLNTLLAMHTDPEGQNILKGMMIGRFVQSDDAAYDNIRKIEQAIRQLDQK